MSRPRHRTLPLTALILLLLASTAQASPRTAAPLLETGFFARAWTWLGDRLPSPVRFLATWGDAGCEMDPDGRQCLDLPTGDEGCEMDPDGRCLATDAGADMDPNGHM